MLKAGNYFDVFFFCRNKIKQECDVLRAYLKKAQDDKTVWLDEKRKLLETVRVLRVRNLKLHSESITNLPLNTNHLLFLNLLQQQLVSAERNIKNDGSR